MGGFQAMARQGLETSLKMYTTWLDMALQQNAQMMKAIKQSLNLDDSSPAAALADFAQQTINSYVEIQKRWLDLAMQLPFSGVETKK
jgi:hypothetical protein